MDNGFFEQLQLLKNIRKDPISNRCLQGLRNPTRGTHISKQRFNHFISDDYKKWNLMFLRPILLIIPQPMCN